MFTLLLDVLSQQPTPEWLEVRFRHDLSKKIPPKEQEDKRCLLSLCDTRLTIIIAKICIRRRHSVSCYLHTIVDLSFRKTVQYNLLLVRCISLHKNVDTTLKS